MATYSMSEALQQFLKESRLKGDVQALQIYDAWESIMGKTVARYTDQIRLIDGKLIITTSVAPLRNELIFQKDKIINKVNELMGAQVVKELLIQ
jgi:hypothetical protein